MNAFAHLQVLYDASCVLSSISRKKLIFLHDSKIFPAKSVDKVFEPCYNDPRKGKGVFE